MTILGNIEAIRQGLEKKKLLEKKQVATIFSNGRELSLS